MSEIEKLLDDADDLKRGSIPRIQFTRDRLIALLQECTPLLSSISAIPTFTDGDLTSFDIKIYVSFARSDFEVK